MQVEAVFSKLAVEAFDERILCWLAGLDKVQFDANALCPEEHGFAGKFGSVVHTEASSGLMVIYL